jgi:hypothetical protein
MWAAKQPDDAPKGDGDVLACIITREIAACKNVVALSDVHDEWGGTFNYIHASAALVKCGKLPGGGRSSLVDELCSTWLKLLPFSDFQGCANVLWACVRLGPGAVQRLWGPTWEAYMQHVQRESAIAGACVPQQIANPLWACAKLRKQPSASELQQLVQTFAVLELAKPQELANVVWALGELCWVRGWQGGVSEQEVEQMLGKQQLQLLAAADGGQAASNVLLGIARMAASRTPAITMGFARDCSKPLLFMVQHQVQSWESRHITNTMWACGELGLADEQFIAAAIAAAPRWVPHSMGLHVNQAVTACAVLQHKDVSFVALLLQRGVQLLSQQQAHLKQGRTADDSSRPLSPGDRDNLAAYCTSAVARLDMQSLAHPAFELLCCSGVAQRSSTHYTNLARLWVFHSWLLQHGLLDGKGLKGLLTEQQLQRGAKEAAAMGLS